MEEREDTLEQINHQASHGQAEAIEKLLDQGKFKQAESLARTADLSPEDWEQISTQADSSIRKLSKEPLPKGHIPTEQAQDVITGAENEAILDYGAKNDPETQNIGAMEGIILENETILQQLEDTIAEAKSQVAGNRWAKPVGFLALPMISDIYAIIKGKKLRKSLKRLEKLNLQLQNPQVLNSKVNADKITPSKGHMATIIGHTTSVAGSVAVLASNPVTAGIGAGAMVAGGITSLVGYIKQIISFSDMGKTKQTLEKLEKKIDQARDTNNMAKMQVSMYQSAYTQGARENLQPMMTA
ncbi:hypothetical protein J7J83_02725 [bacterium]|nr:hypothetical protein [bacterium]